MKNNKVLILIIGSLASSSSIASGMSAEAASVIFSMFIIFIIFVIQIIYTAISLYKKLFENKLHRNSVCILSALTIIISFNLGVPNINDFGSLIAILLIYAISIAFAFIAWHYHGKENA